ncbi:MAG: hypothetical protein AT718_08465 [Vulcanisaeta sp. JCHS_4]|jgi:hypothetical protein|nr:MAG: hypothetical protein AT718_08465 [Vulcanisaeta sp. JCHS_4]
MINSKTTTKGQSSAIELVLIIPVIITAIIVFILLVPNYSYTAGSEVNTFTLNAMAQSLLEYIITNPGNPPNWGLNASQLSSFGLAVPNQPYHLDPFKVLELAYWELANYKQSSLAVCYANQTATGFQQFLSQYGITALYNSFNWVLTPTAPTYWLLNYTAVKQMLGLGRNYNLMLVIYPVFRVKIVPINGTQLATFLVNVTKFDTGQPVPNATVYVSYIAISFSSNNKENIVVGNVTGITSSSGSFVFTINIAPSSTSFYYIDAYASLGGLGDHGLYFNSTNNPLLSVVILPSPNAPNINWVIFAHPHVLKGCISTCNPGQTALGLRVVGVFKSIYGYTFSALNFTLNPGQGSVSYPSTSCQYLTTSQKSNNYADCYWALPQTPMLLIAFVTRNSQSTSCNTPLTQIIVIPYGMLPEYYLSNRKIIFGYSEKYTPVGTAKSIVYIGDSAYYVTLYLYYGGNVFGPMR